MTSRASKLKLLNQTRNSPTISIKDLERGIPYIILQSELHTFNIKEEVIETVRLMVQHPISNKMSKITIGKEYREIFDKETEEDLKSRKISGTITFNGLEGKKFLYEVTLADTSQQPVGKHNNNML